MRHLMKCMAVLLGMTVAWAWQGPARADQIADNANRMAEIVVSATPLRGSEAAGTVHRITAEQIRQQGARTLDEALQLIPGIIVREGPEGTPRIDIRGFRTRHVQLFINGIPIRETFDDQFDPTTIPVSYIAEIKVTTGGGSVLYGQGGNGGSIDIITKQGQKGIQGAIGAQAGEGDHYIGSASVGAGNDKFNAYAAASYDKRDHFITADKFETPEGLTDQRLNSDRRRANFFGNGTYRLAEHTQLGLTAIHNAGENGKPPVTNYSSSDPFAKKPKYERTDNLDDNLFQAVLTADPDGPAKVRAWTYYNQNQQEDNVYDDPTATPGATNDPDTWTQTGKGASHQDSDTRILGVSTQFTYQVSKAGAATLALNAEKDTWEADGFTVTNNSGTRAAIADKREMNFYSAALEYDHNFSDRLGGVIGYGHHFMIKDEGDNENDFSYLIGAFYDLSDSTHLRVNHARKVRFPSINQLYDGTSQNPNLVPETTYHYEVGLDQTLPARSALQVTGFYIEADNFIEKDTSNINQNFQKLRFQGIETALTTRALPNTMLRVAYTYLDTEDQSPNATRQELQYRPTHTWVLEGQYTFAFGLNMHASLKHVAGQYFYDSNDIEKKKLGDFTVVNLKLNQTIGASGLQVYVGADNLLDEAYEESYGLPQPGRTLYAGVEYHF
jgi:outer membrane receptor protein involved in Fe transport